MSASNFDNSLQIIGRIDPADTPIQQDLDGATALDLGSCTPDQVRSVSQRTNLPLVAKWDDIADKKDLAGFEMVICSNERQLEMAKDVHPRATLLCSDLDLAKQLEVPALLDLVGPQDGTPESLGALLRGVIDGIRAVRTRHVRAVRRSVDLSELLIDSAETAGSGL